MFAAKTQRGLTSCCSVFLTPGFVSLQVLELICTRESGAVFEAGGLNCVLSFIRDSGHLVHKDTLHSAMAVVSRLCSKMEPQDSSLETCVESLSSLLKHEDHQVTARASLLIMHNESVFCSFRL